MVHTQVSMRSYETGQWALEMDANLAKDRAWANGLGDDIEWTWLLPPEYRRSPEWRKGVPERVNVAATSWPYNVQAARYHFQFEENLRVVKQWKPDLMILEVPEHARAWRMVQEHLGVDFPIVSYMNYLGGVDWLLDRSEATDTRLRLIDGLDASDLIVFNTPGLLERWKSGLTFDLGYLARRATVWRASYSMDEFGFVPRGTKTRPVLNFTSRLTDENRTRWPQLFVAAGRIEGLDVWVGNPNRSQTIDAVADRLGRRPERFGYSSREEYVQSMQDASISTTFWPQDDVYSTAYCDTIASGCIPIVAALDPGAVAGIAVRPRASVSEIEEALRRAISLWNDEPEAHRAAHENLQWLADNRSVQRNGKQMRDEMEALLA